jgi:hypothetical protein
MEQLAGIIKAAVRSRTDFAWLFIYRIPYTPPVFLVIQPESKLANPFPTSEGVLGDYQSFRFGSNTQNAGFKTGFL